MNLETKEILKDLARECEHLVKRHRAASNEVLAAILSEAFLDDAAELGLDRSEAHAAFARFFPTFSLYL